jgi:CubicO group peptidase (beta-lactamase class C family)
MPIFQDESSLSSVVPEEVGMSSDKASLLVKELNIRINQGHLPGAVLMAVRNHKIAVHEAIGYRDRIANLPMQKDTIFRIASMTKPIVSVGVLMLAEQGKLSLEDPLANYLPEFENMQVGVEKTNAEGKRELSLVPSRKKITLQDLMRHTSGLTYGWDKNALVDQLYDKHQILSIDQTLDEQMKKLAALPLKHQPGTTWEYGLSTDVLGRVIEVISGDSLDVFLKKNILNPLEMFDTDFGVTPDKLNRMAEAQINPETGQRYINVASGVKPKKFSGGGGLTSTALDFAKFCQMILNKGELNGQVILSRKSIELMTANHLPDTTIYPAANLFEWGSAMPLPAHFGTGFGLGFKVRLEAGKNPSSGSVGDLTWMGIWGTSFVIDPKENLILILLTQQPNRLTEYHRLLRQMGYAMLQHSTQGNL